MVASAASFDGSAFVEAVIHEAIHVVDTASPGGLPAALRDALRDAGAARPVREGAPHTLVFVAATAAVRSALDPAHVPVGESHGAYARGLERYRRAVEPAFSRHVSGELGREAMVAGVVEALLALSG